MGKNISGKYKQWAMREVYDPNIRQGRIYAKKNIKWDKERYFISLKATINNKV